MNWTFVLSKSSTAIAKSIVVPEADTDANDTLGAAFAIVINSLTYDVTEWTPLPSFKS